MRDLVGTGRQRKQSLSNVRRRNEFAPGSEFCLTLNPGHGKEYYTMPEPKTMSAVLKAAVNDAIADGATFRSIERESGVLRQSLMMFVKDEQGLQLAKADLLARYFKLELRPMKKAR